MRETRPSGSEGGEAGCNRPFLPLSNKCGCPGIGSGDEAVKVTKQTGLATLVR
jgi:hypothetical protein